MKNTTSIILSSVLASTLTLGSYIYVNSEKTQPKILEQKTNFAKQVNFTNSSIASVDFREAAKKSMPAVVHIKSSKNVRAASYNQQIPPQFRGLFDQFFGMPYSENQNQSEPQSRPMGSGSGVIIDNQGYIVTNNHVIKDADELEVVLNDNRTYKATIVGTDPTTDIALLQISENNLPYLAFNNSDHTEVGEWVLAVGNPFNLNSTVTAGIVSAKGRNINILKEKSAIESFIQTDAAINPGNSGGALVNLNGDLIGINTAIASPTGAYSGYGFAVPSNIVQKIVKDLKEYGVVQRGYLGVVMQSLNSEIAKEEDISLTEGVFVHDFSEESSAKKAGLEKGDVIIAIDEKQVKSGAELQELIGRKRPGDKVNVTVHRNGKEKQYLVTLLDSKGKNTLEAKASSKSKIMNLLGADFTESSKETNRALGISNGIEVQNIRSGKISTHTRMQNGFVITKVNHKPVKSIKAFEEIVASASGGVLIEGYYLDRPGLHYYALGL